jgi:P-type Ca2+ transporter type 2C
MPQNFNKTGLSTVEARKRLAEYGPNSLPEARRGTLLRRFIRQFQSPLIYILLFAVLVDLLIWWYEGASGIPYEAAAIAAILILNTALGMYQEGKSEAALARLKEMAAPLAWVRRDGRLLHIPAAELVPGDVVHLEAGDRIPADGLAQAAGVLIDESILTGESLPIEKNTGDELFSGTLLMRGKAELELTRTGPESTMGKLALMIGSIETGKTPLEARLDTFARQIAKVILALAIAIVVGGLMIEGVDRLGHVLIFAVALAVAAIPEGLPAVLTLTLSLGVERMAKRKAVIRRLSSVETLGSVTVILTDKTGTLTENKMNVRKLVSADRERALRAMVLANDAERESGVGDPLEIALLDFAAAEDVDLISERDGAVRISSVPFDSSYKFMRVTVNEDGSPVSYLKGAPEVLLERSTLSESERDRVHAQIEDAAAEGSRMLALGWREGEGESEIEFLGFVEIWDPPRPEVPGAIASALSAGIRVIMATGDHPETAKAVAGVIGIPEGTSLIGSDISGLSKEELQAAVRDAAVFARVTPEQKLKLVEALLANGEIVAMTGDGINDAPALKRADVGIAMGNRGSDVSREVADLVLMDDNFATIVAAIEEGRNIYENIQKFIRFLFSTNFALVLLVVFGVFGSFFLGLVDDAGGLLLPLTAVQLLWINIVADGPPALALGLDHDPNVMSRPPRDPARPLLDQASIRFIVSTGSFKALMGGLLLVFMPRFGYSVLATRTGVFLFESIVQLVMAYPSRKITVAPATNITLHIAVFGGILLQLATIAFEPLRALLGLEPLDAAAIALVGGAIVVTWLAAELFLYFDRRKYAI